MFIKNKMLLIRNELNDDTSVAMSHLVYPVWFYQLVFPILVSG